MDRYSLITLILACVSAFLIPYLKSKFSAEQFSNIMMRVNIAVEAAVLELKLTQKEEASV